MRNTIAISAAASLLLIAGCAGAADAEPAEPPFKAALDACDLPEVPAAKLGDDGETLILDGANEDGWGLSHERMDCLLGALNIPDSVDAQMGATRALDGMQTATWDGITATWTYHPDAGLDITLKFTPAAD